MPYRGRWQQTGWGPTCVDGKGEPNDWLGGTFLVEEVPILLDEVFEATSGNGGGGARSIQRCPFLQVQRRMSEWSDVTGVVFACVTAWPHAGNRNRSLSILLP